MIEVPQVTDGQEALEEFARSFDGYEQWGEGAVPRLLEWEQRFARSGELPEGPADLRAALFMAWRAYDRSGRPGTLSPFFFAALERIREVEGLLGEYTRLRDGVLEVAIVDWPHPHEPVLVWHRFHSWKDTPTPVQIERARQRALTTKKYFFRCKFCQELCNTGHRHEKDVCQGCANAKFGVVY